MGATQDLAAAGFEPAEVNAFAAQKRQALLGGGFSAKEANDYLGDSGDPDLAAGNKSLARTLGNAMKPAFKTVEDVSSVYAPIETGLNAATGLLFGFPAYIGAALGGLTAKHALGMDVDPKEMAETISRAFTYIPQTERGKRLTGNVMMPLDYLTSTVAPAAGHAVTRAGMALNAPEGVSATAGAVTDASIQMLPAVLLSALGRRMAGNIPASEDFANTAKVIAGDGAAPQAVAAVETKLRATYEATGIDPITVAEDAKRNPQVAEALTTAPKEGEPLPALYPEFQPKAEGLVAEGEGGTPPGGAQSGQPGGPLLDVAGPTVAERREAASPQTVDMNLGVNPATAVKAYADSYTPYVGVEKPEIASKPGGIVDSIQKIIAPTTRGDLAEQAAGMIRESVARRAHEQEVALEKTKVYAAEFDKLSVEDQYKFTDDYERGGIENVDPKFRPVAAAMKAFNDDLASRVQALGKGQLENVIENYLGRIWKDPEEKVAAVMARRPLTGSGDFLKQRFFEYQSDGIAAGLTPITSNPIEMMLLKGAEIRKYIYGQNLFEELKSVGFTKFTPFGDYAPDSWTKINDKIARVFQHSEIENGMILRGEYYAPDQVATLINNHLSPGLQGGKIFDSLRMISNSMNTLQLGMSFYHVGFTTFDSIASKITLGIKQISRGDFAEGTGNIAVGLTPTQPFLNLYKGDRLLRAYLGKLDDPELAPIVEALIQGGGRAKIDDFYKNATVNAFKQAIRSGDAIEAAKQFLPTLLDHINAPVFQQLVPRQKLGVFFDMARDWLDKNPKATADEKRIGLGKLWDSVDNRMGQLTYDNLFWNRALKDSLLVAVRSTGWDLGTYRELGGGIVDIGKIASQEQTGFQWNGLTDRTAYVVGLAFLGSVYGAVTQYLYTGEAPRDLKDLQAPRTGRTRPDGSEDRVMLPTYLKDVASYSQAGSDFAKYGSNPMQPFLNKASPLISTAAQMLNNQDFYGGAIRNPSASLVEQAKDEANYLIHQIEPFSLRNYQQQAKLKGEEPSVAGYLTSPSMYGIAPAPGYITKSPEEKESEQVSKLRDSLVKRFRQEIKDGAVPGELIPQMLKAGLSRQDIKFIIRSSGDIPRGHRLKSFGKDEE